MKATHSLIIGGTRGIGRQVVHQFLQQGSEVSVIARRPPVQKAAMELPAHYWPLDIRDEAALAAAVPRLIAQRGKINHLVFLQRYRGTDERWRGEIETTVTATKNVITLLQDEFAAGEKSIVIVSSINAVLIANYLPLEYHVAKAALCQMVRYFAVMLGPRGIRVNSVSPGTVLKEESKDSFLENEALRELYLRITPLGRFGLASEVAKIVAMLCSDQASFVTGQDIVVDGGVSLQWQESLARELAELAYPCATKPEASKQK